NAAKTDTPLSHVDRDWTLDDLGNWTGLVTNEVSDNVKHSANSTNEITTVNVPNEAGSRLKVSDPFASEDNDVWTEELGTFSVVSGQDVHKLELAKLKERGYLLGVISNTGMTPGWVFRAYLESLGIKLVHDLPGVGQNMKNHPSLSVRFRPKEGYSLNSDSPRNQVALRSTSPGSGTRNDIQIQPLTSGPLGREAEEIRVGCRLELPLSTGELTLTSNDPNVQPKLDYRFLVDAWDRERLREAVRLCVRLFQHQAFHGIVEELIAPSEVDLASDASLDAWLQANVGIAGHTSGTCKMGPESDPLAVVDQYCRVRGLENLRVIDASVMPEIPRANTNATVIMVAERVADFIREGAP
ncbi:MAG: hypothetical protein IIC97_09480, partial [Chloroflexi bacterium]|nr:hypothetical protein [Chloroflexota bacterium]